MSLCRRNSVRNKVTGKKQIYQDRTLVRDASGQARNLCLEDLLGYSFVLQGEWGLEKLPLPFQEQQILLGTSKACIQISRRGGPQTPALGLNLNVGLTPCPTQGPEAILALALVKQNCLVLKALSSYLLKVTSQCPLSFPHFLWSFIRTSKTTCAYSIPITNINYIMYILTIAYNLYVYILCTIKSN